MARVSSHVVYAAVGKAVLRTILDGVFPPACLGCGAAGDWLCSTCLIGLPLTGEVNLPPDSALDSLTAVSPYRDPIVGGLIRSFKYQRALCLEEEAFRQVLQRFSHSFAFAQELQRCPPTMILPLPMDPERERVRGMDHAFRLSQLVQERLFPSVSLARVLTRTRVTRTNAQLASAEARVANVREVFACTRNMEGESILLVDDVYTTGATLNEAAQCVKRAGARAVHAFVLAHGQTSK